MTSPADAQSDMIVQASDDLLRKRKRMPILRQLPVTAETAEMLAVQALTFIAQDEERLGRFLSVTGIGPAEIRDAAREANFLAGVLDHIAGDERLLLAFAEQAGINPAEIPRARTALEARSARKAP
jgi:hypothetical protein